MAEPWFPAPPLADDVVLRPWRETDVPGIVRAFSDPEQEEARLHGEGLTFALVEPRERERVSGCSLDDVRLDQGRAAVGYWLAPEARGRGLVTHAVRLLLLRSRVPFRDARRDSVIFSLLPGELR